MYVEISKDKNFAYYLKRDKYIVNYIINYINSILTVFKADLMLIYLSIPSSLCS